MTSDEAEVALSPDERDYLAHLVEWLYGRSGAPTWAEFARVADVPYQGLVNRWSKGKGGISGANLLRLLRAGKVLSVLDTLDDSDRELWRLVYEEGLSVADVAHRLQTHETTVNVRLARLRRTVLDAPENRPQREIGVPDDMLENRLARIEKAIQAVPEVVRDAVREAMLSPLRADEVAEDEAERQATAG